MTLTFLDLYNECAGQPWSMYDADAESIDDLETALKTSINKALSYLWNLQDWSFRITSTNIKTRINKSNYTIPDGIILKKTIKGAEKYLVKYEDTFLEYEPDYEVLEPQEGEPESFYVEGENLYIYPTPDNTYTINIRYLMSTVGLDADYNPLYELVNEDDYIDIPEKYEVQFKNCLISLAMMYAIADENDENYSGYKKQYEDALNTLNKYCKNSIQDRYIRF